jgi:O-antigen/teichoic acid export membrane protein
VQQILRVKCWLAAAALGASWAAAQLVPALRADVPVLVCLSAVLIIESFATLFRCVFRIEERMAREAGLWALDGTLKLAVVAVVCVAPGAGDPLRRIAAGWVCVGLLSLGVALAAVRASWSGAGAPAPAEGWRSLLRQGVPLVVIYAMSLMNIRLIILLLNIYAGPAEAGQFGVGERLLEVLLVIPLALSQVMLPMSARLAGSSVGELRALASRVLVRLVAVAAPATVAVAAISGTLIVLIVGEGFRPAAELMGLLGWALLPLSIKPVIEKILCGLHRQDVVWRAYLAVTAGLAMALAVAIPAAGARGATICLLAAEWLNVAVLLAALRRWLLRPAPLAVELVQPASVH